MAEAPGFIIVFSFPYRDEPEEWSQGYHIRDAWVDEADFRATADVIRVQLADCLSARTTFERIIGYQDRSAPHDFVYDWVAEGHSFHGALDTSDLTPMPGDTAAWLKWKIARKTSHGKPIYLRKYFHDVYADEDGDPDQVAGAQNTAFSVFGAEAKSGSWDGHVIGDKFGAATVGDAQTSPWLTTRTLERRGKRPTPP